MPTDGWEPVLRMLVAFGLVAAVAAPAGLIGWRLGRRAAPPELPVPPGDDPLITFGYVLCFLAHPVLVALAGQAGLAKGVTAWLEGDSHTEQVSVWRAVIGTCLTTPFLLAAWLGFRAWSGRSASWRAASRSVAVGVMGWLIASPVVYSVHIGAERASVWAGFTAQEHPLVQLAAEADLSRALLLFAAVAAATPFAEELVFRGLLLGLLIRRPNWAVVPIALAAVVTATSAGAAVVPAMLFLLIACGGLLAVRKDAALHAVWATATLFAAVHSSVWPTPVPLFVLGLALGAVAVRTGGVLAGTVLHGLFNAVSLVYLLRG